jgi:hypothetical protein
MPLMDNTNSAIKVTPSLEQEIARASSNSEILAVLHRAAIDQKIVEPDPFDDRGDDWGRMHIVEPGSSPRGYATTVTIDGIKHVLGAASEQELLAKETNLYRQALAGSTNTPAGTEQARDTNGRFITQPSQAELEAEAERLANIDPAAIALAPSVAAALRAQGISVEDLREYTASKQREAVQQSWVSATETFRNSSAGSDWPGGTRNRQKLGECLAELGLADSPSAENLSKAYAYMKKNNMLVENEEIALANKVNSATSYEDLKAQIGYKGYDGSSGLWGR